MALPKLIDAFSDARCFTTAEAAKAVGLRSAVESIRYLRERGYIVTVRRGLYAFVAKREGDGPDRFVLASKVAAPYALSFHSALELHGVTQAASFSTVFIGTPRRPAHFSFEGAAFRSVLLSSLLLRRGSVTLRRSGQKISVASRELTLLQAADRPDYCGGLDEVMQAIRGFPSIDWPALEEMLRLFGKAALNRKVGFLVERNADRWNPPAPIMAFLDARVGRGATYFGTKARAGGRLVRRWRVIVPARFLEAERIG